MIPSSSGLHVVIVIGAGPAGLAAANMLAKAGHEVIVLNRDIKFGGLAEYGIFPSKLKLRGGLRKSYWEMLERPNVHYFGNVSVGTGKDLTVDDLRSLEASALIFATGAQGTKTIGVDGDSATGVYHAKDVVYHFNQLPGFSTHPFEMGRRVAVIGVGDVMVDIAHWLIRYKRVEEVTAIARRGPAERKYNPKEIRAVCQRIDRDALAAEFARIRPRLIEAGQNPDEILKGMLEEFTRCETYPTPAKMTFRFLASPKRVLTDAHNRMRGLEIEENRLEAKGGDFAAVGLKQYYELSCDTVIFAVGDRVDETLGLPYKNGAFITNPNKTGNDPDDALFQAYDDKTSRVMEGIFLTGWARKASEGLVGVAKRDGEWTAEVVTRYLETQPLRDHAAAKGILPRLQAYFADRRIQAVTIEDLRILEDAEKQVPTAHSCIGEFKYATNEEMLDKIQKGRDRLRAPAAR